jgi:hypothetical protein
MTDLVATKQNYSFIATTPAQMETAQRDMIRWCDDRLEREKVEIADLERTIAEAQKAGIKDQAWRRRLSMSRAKMTFYRKIKSALLQGYYIVPPFPVQLFAIRTNKEYPESGVERNSWSSDFLQKPQRLPEGEGDYRNPFPEKASDTYQDADKDGKAITVTEWFAGQWKDVDFPFKMVKPEVIAAVGKALQEKIFDALGVLPQYKTPDPIVIGQIIPPHRPNDPLAFFVAWWMDPKDL